MTTTLPARWLQPSIHPVYARLACAELIRKGFAPEAILAGTRLDWERLHVDNHFISLEQLRRLLHRAIELSRCPWLGIDIGLHAQLSLHGALGQAVAASPDVGQALALVQRYMPVRQRLMGLRLEIDAVHATLVVDEYLMPPELRECLLGYLAGTVFRLVETVTGRSLASQVRIEWPFAKPSWAAQYTRLAHHNSFGHTCLRGVLPVDLLQVRNLSADADAMRLAERECERQLTLQERGGSVSQRIQSRLAACDGRHPGIAEMAALENMSVRTLIRHLRGEGTTYQEMLDTVREELACWLLLQTPLPVESVAVRVGYEDTSNFSRTFRRWVGMTPSEFRAGATR